MADKKKYYTLDNAGIVGVQSTKSGSSLRYHIAKTGAFIRQMKEAGSSLKGAGTFSRHTTTKKGS